MFRSSGGRSRSDHDFDAANQDELSSFRDAELDAQGAHEPDCNSEVHSPNAVEWLSELEGSILQASIHVHEQALDELAFPARLKQLIRDLFDHAPRSLMISYAIQGTLASFLGSVIVNELRLASHRS